MDSMMINLFEILQCFSDAVDMMLPEFVNHQHQVAMLAYRIAQHMGLSESSQRNVLMAGLVHDVGAISIRERLELIESEPVTVHSHGFRAARLLEEYGPFSLTADIVRYHHLPWEESIPVGSRIMAVADVLAAVTEPRPYRDGMSREKTIETLSAMADDGALNRHIVSLALDNIDSLREICLESRVKAEEEYRRFFDI